MKLKKFLATSMAAVMSMSMMVTPVFASAMVEPGEGGALEVEGDTTYVETTQYKVTLPTTSSLQFALDPEGLVGYFRDNASETTIAPDTDMSGYIGKIVGSGVDQIVNESSVPVKITCSFYLTNADDVTLVNKKDTDWDATGNMVLLQAIAANATAAAADDFAATADETPDMATNFKVAIDSTDEATPSVLKFALAPAEYAFKKNGDVYTYERTSTAVDDTNKAVFTLGGFVSADGDWTNMSNTKAGSKLTLNCVYKFDGVKAIEAGTIDASTNVVVDESKLTTLTVKPRETVNVTSEPGKTASVNLWTEDKTVSSVVLVNYTSKAGALTAYNKPSVAGTHHVLKDGKFTVAAGTVGNFNGATFRVTYSDGFVQTIVWTAETGPKAEIALNSPSGTAATVDLKTANKTVSTVWLVTYTDASGKVNNYNKAAVVNSHYTLTNGVFTMPSTATTGFKSATFKVTYDDGFVQTITYTRE